MKILHTSDWHVGKKIRGHDRSDEHRQVMAEIVGHARDHDVDLVLVAGDLFDTAAPTAESEAIVYQTLLQLAADGTHVAVIAGNHDHARRLSALRPLLELGRIHTIAEPTRPDDGGLIDLEVGGDHLRLAMLPFVSQRGIVRADDLMTDAAFEHAGAYADRMRRLIEVLTRSFSADSVNVVMAHAFVVGGAAGGGERAVHLADEYAVTAQAFPPSATYVALGHLHRAQQIAGPAPLHYCGSPLQLDFGEEQQQKQVNLVEARPGAPAQVTPLLLDSGRPLRTLNGSLDELRDVAADVGDAWLRVHMSEARRADLATDVRNLLGENVVDVTVDQPREDQPQTARRRTGRSATELFDEYLSELGIEDDRLGAMFAELLEAESIPAP